MTSIRGVARPFLAGLFLICMCSLMLQIIETRLLSVISWYYLAFCAISMAMFGMTAGSLLIYFNAGRFKAERMLEHLSWISWGFALAIAGSGLMIISTVILSVTGTAMLALSDLAGERLADARTGKNGRHALVGMLRQAVFGRLAGYEDVNDAERLRHDPAMRWIVGGKAAAGCAASASQMGRLETRWLASGRNLSALADLSGQWIDKVHARRPPRGVVLDMDSSVSPTHGEQEMSVWNGHYECTCYHPLFVFNQFGDLERCALRPGNVHSADGWEGVLKPVVARYRGKVSRIYFRADAGFANPDVYEFLETERIKYAIRLPVNRILQERIGHLLKRPVGRPSFDVRRSYANFTYQAGSWTKPRRVVAKVEWHPGELYPRVGFIVTNMARPAENVIAFYNKRGTCEQWIKEGKGAIRWTRLSCRSFAANAVRLQLHALAYNLGNFLRTLATPEPIKDWSLTSLKEKLIKIGAKVVSHGRYVAFQMAEVAIPRNLFADILRLIAELRPPPVTSTA